MSTSLILLSEFRKTEIELWRPVVGYAGYDVSNLGRVRSWRIAIGQGRWRGTYCGRRKEPKLMTPCPKDTGRLQVVLALGKKNSKKSIQVHTLVARAFISNPDNLPEVNHRTGIYTDNRAGNLEWVSSRRNIEHAVEHGLFAFGERMAAAKLKDADVVEIRRRRDAGETCVSISKDYPVSKVVIAKVARRATWKHVPEHG